MRCPGSRASSASTACSTRARTPLAQSIGGQALSRPWVRHPAVDGHARRLVRSRVGRSPPSRLEHMQLASSVRGGSMMAREACQSEDKNMSRRGLIKTVGVVAGAVVVAPRVALGQAPASGPVAPPSTITSPPRDFGPNGAPTTYFTDPDVLTVEPAFNGLRQPNAPIQRLWTGALWSEGPAWNSQGRYLVWSDIPNNRQLRWLEDDGRVTVFRSPSNNSNGNTFDFQGRQLSCEHLTRRVVRYENDG